MDTPTPRRGLCRVANPGRPRSELHAGDGFSPAARRASIDVQPVDDPADRARIEQRVDVVAILPSAAAPRGRPRGAAHRLRRVLLVGADDARRARLISRSRDAARATSRRARPSRCGRALLIKGRRTHAAYQKPRKDGNRGALLPVARDRRRPPRPSARAGCARLHRLDAAGPERRPVAETEDSSAAPDGRRVLATAPRYFARRSSPRAPPHGGVRLESAWAQSTAPRRLSAQDCGRLTLSHADHHLLADAGPPIASIASSVCRSGSLR